MMLTRNDRTVDDAEELVDAVLDYGVTHIGFKDVGVDKKTLATLAERGYLARDGRTYVPGPGLTRLQARAWAGVLAATIGVLLLLWHELTHLAGRPLGVAYALWSGIGTALVAVVGWLVYRQQLDLPAVAGIALIIAGTLVVNLFSKVSAH